jgi:PiT family inorganic phosphate transporter
MSFWPVIIAGATLFVAYANGANDNFKGVATLFGSGTTDYRKALWWATVTTLAGSVAAFFWATQLVSMFQGNGLLPAFLIQSQPFIAAVILGAALTVISATKIGIPISTTHSLTGALCGGGLVAVGFEIGFQTLIDFFFLPLLVSPLVAVSLAAVGYPLLDRALRFSSLTKENCLCVASEAVLTAATPGGITIRESTPGLRVIVERQSVCAQPFSGALFGINAQNLFDIGHFLSAGAVSFARGLNDAPKIVAMGLAVGALDLQWSIGSVAVVMALGGLLNARKVAETVSKRITPMEPDHGFVANIVTSFLVIFASRWGLPVSTTHVSCGSLFGIGIANGQANWGVIRTILFAWILTLPLAAASAGLIYSILNRVTAG